MTAESKSDRHWEEGTLQRGEDEKAAVAEHTADKAPSAQVQTVTLPKPVSFIHIQRDLSSHVVILGPAELMLSLQDGTLIPIDPILLSVRRRS